MSSNAGEAQPGAVAATAPAPSPAAVSPASSEPAASGVSTSPAADAPQKRGCCRRPQKGPAKEPEKKVPFLSLFRYATCTDIILMIIASIAAAGNGIIFPMFTILFGELLNAFNAPLSNFVEEINKYALYFLIIALAAGIAAFLEVTLPMITAERQIRRVREEYLKALLRQDQEWYDTNRAGEVASRMAEDSIQFYNGIGDKIQNTIHYTITFIAGLAVAFSKSWAITLVVMCVLPMIVVVMSFLMISTQKFESRSAAAYARAGDTANEVFSQIRTVAAFGGEEAEVRRYDKHLEKAEMANRKKGFWIGAAVGGIFGCIFMIYGVAAWVGVTLIAANRDDHPECRFNPTLSQCFTGGHVINTLMSVIIGAFSLGQAAPNFASFASAQAAAYKMYSVISRQPTIDITSEKGQKPSVETLTGKIEFKNVTFRYPSRPQEVILRDFSLIIEPGKSYALCGPSGCGKSTIFALIQRLYDPEAGSVLVDGINVKDWNLKYLRDRIAVVSQEPTLFATTVGENVGYGKPSDMPAATREEIEAACKAANIHNDIVGQLKLGYDEVVGTSVSSTKLSGGQRQRCCIARAIIRDPRILLLDEATSALDTTSERLVQAALDKLVGGESTATTPATSHRRTTLTIAHRLSTIVNCAQIIVLRKGSIVERGTHEELMAMETGLYRELRLQQDLQTSKNSLTGHAHHHAPHATTAAPSGGAAATGTTAGSSESISVRIPVEKDSDNSTGTGSQVSINVSPSSTPTSPVSPSPTAATSPKAEASTPVPSANADADKDDAADVLDPNAKKVSSWRVWAMQMPHWPWIITGLIAAGAAGTMQPLFSIVYSSMITVFYQPNTETMKNDMKPYVGYFFAVAIGLWICNTLRIGSFVLLGEILTRKLRTMTFEAAVRQDMAFFDDPRNAVGRLNTRLASDAAEVKGATGEALSLVFQAGAAIIAGLVISFTACWQLAFVLMGIMPLMILSSLMQGKAFKGFSMGAAKALEESGHIATEATSAIRTVTAFNLQPQMLKAFATSLDVPMKKGFGKAFAAGTGQGFSQSMQFMAFALGFYCGGQFISLGLMDFNALMKTFMAITMASQAAGNAINWGPNQAAANMAMQKIFALIDRPREIDPMDDTKGIKPEKPLEGSISFEGVEFAYPTRKQRKVLDGLNFTVQPGQKVALVGSSGCGKSTVIQLLLRFYNPSSGRILIDGRPIEDYNVKWLRAHFGLVQQEPSLFADCVRYNIEYGRANSKPDIDTGITPEIIEAEKQRLEQARKAAEKGKGGNKGAAAGNATEESATAAPAEVSIQLNDQQAAVPADVLAASTAAHADTFIQGFKYKYATHCGARGMELSGGQRSRIAIARAIIRKPNVLLLDEATAALDSVSEAIVQEALDNVINDNTATGTGSAICVAHRLATIKNSQAILVFDQGRVAEQGTHEELMAKENGLYRTLALAQDGTH